MITREFLQQKLAQAEQAKDQQLAAANVHQGQIFLLRELLQRLDAEATMTPDALDSSDNGDRPMERH
jgi:hypothetical protein